MNPAYLDTGNLQIFVTAGETPEPIPGALVRITDPENGQILEEAATDASGQTPFIELPAPPMELSVAEGEAGQQRPYAVYNVTITAEGRETLHIGGVEAGGGLIQDVHRGGAAHRALHPAGGPVPGPEREL